MKFPVARDIVERVLSTFVLTLLTLATADGINWADWADLRNWQSWGVAALAAAFSLFKGLLASQIGKRGGAATSASLDPGVQLAPVDVSGPR